jgi:hypothetical protein
MFRVTIDDFSTFDLPSSRSKASLSTSHILPVGIEIGRKGGGKKHYKALQENKQWG